MLFIQNHTGGNLNGPEMRWLGRKGIVVTSGTFGSGGVVQVNWRPTQDVAFINVETPTANSVTEFEAGFGYLSVRFVRGTANSANLTVEVQERPLGY